MTSDTEFSVADYIQYALNVVWDAGGTPSIIVDATHDDVLIPDFVRARWRDNLCIELNANYPLNMHTDKSGLHLDLAFSGQVSRCTFPWNRIYMLVNSLTSKAIVLPAHTPASFKVSPASSVDPVDPVVDAHAVVPTSNGRSLRVIEGGKERPKLRVIRGGKS